jgi:septal ring factor EnvC (AmiA/AmiB activator)
MKKSIVFCFLLLLSLPCFSQEQAFSFRTDVQLQSVNWETLEQNLNDLEQNLTTLQTNNLQLQATLNELQKSVAIQKEYLAKQSLAYKDLESRYTQSESSLKKWKLACGITVAVTVPVIVTLAIILANNRKN